MSQQKSQATLQRRNLVLESIRRLSGKSLRWVTGSEIVQDLKAKGYTVESHNIRRDLKALLPLHPQLEVNDNSKGDEGPINGLPHGYCWVGTDVEPTTGLTLAGSLIVGNGRTLLEPIPAGVTHPVIARPISESTTNAGFTQEKPSHSLARKNQRYTAGTNVTVTFDRTHPVSHGA